MKSIFHFSNDVFYLIFVLQDVLIPEHYELKGPPVDMVESVASFGAKHKEIKIVDGVYFAVVNREFTDVVDYFKHLLKDEYVVSRCKSIEYLQ